MAIIQKRARISRWPRKGKIFGVQISGLGLCSANKSLLENQKPKNPWLTVMVDPKKKKVVGIFEPNIAYLKKGETIMNSYDPGTQSNPETDWESPCSGGSGEN